MALITIKIERPLRGPDAQHGRRRSTALVLGAAAVLVGGLFAASAAQAAGVVSIPPKVLLTNVALGAHKSVAVSVLGGSTTVPTDATRVVLSAAVIDPAANGTLFAFPQGNQPGASGDTLPYTNGQNATGTFTEPVGTSNRVRFVNQGAAAIRLSVSLTGYSTEVRAGDISAAGGIAGQVLTNTGTGAAWQPTGHAYGAFNNTSVPISGEPGTTVASITVPAGSYVVTFTMTLLNNTTASFDPIECLLLSPEGHAVGTLEFGGISADIRQSQFTSEGLLSNTSGGTISAFCLDMTANNPTPTLAAQPELIANSVGAISDQSGNAPARNNAPHVGPRLPTIHQPHPATR
jgi:hypothetical protein